MAVKFEDYSMRVCAAIDDAVISYLHEAAGEITSQTKRNTRVASGELKNSWDYIVYDGEKEAVIGSPLQNAIWEEYGTGEYAVKGNGRKGGWYYQDAKKKWHHTYGKTPNRALHSAFNTLKSALIKRAEEVLKARLR